MIGFGKPASTDNLEAMAPPDAPNTKRKRKLTDDEPREVLNCLGFVRSGSSNSNEL